MEYCDRTVSNITCQRWDVMIPHEPVYQPPENDRHHNYCRNPDDDVRGNWCYTSNPKRRWEYCHKSCTFKSSTTAISIDTTVPVTIETTGDTTASTVGNTTVATNYTTMVLGTADTPTASHPRQAVSEQNTLWYPYVIGAAAAVIIIFAIIVLIVILRRKRDLKSANGTAMTESSTASLYEDVPEDTLPRARENTYTEIPFFAGYLTGYNNPTPAGSRRSRNTRANSSASDCAVYQNVGYAQEDTDGSSRVVGKKEQEDRDAQQTSYEIPIISEDMQKTRSLPVMSYSRQISSQQAENMEGSNDASGKQSIYNVESEIYRVPTAVPTATEQEDGYETPCFRKNGTVTCVRSLEKLNTTAKTPDAAIKDDTPMVCISPTLIDHEWTYEGVDESDTYATPTSPVFLLEDDGRQRYSASHTNDRHVNAEASSKFPEEGTKDEYCTMDNAADARQNSEKVVTLSRTYVTMHSADSPKSIKEIKKILKAEEKKKRKTK